MKIHRHFPLDKLNTFGLSARAEQFARVRTVAALHQLISRNRGPFHILGGGSNILLTGDLAGLTIKNEIKYTHIEKEDKQSTWVSAGGGTVWHKLVLWCIKKNLGGLENLSLIPGSVGAAPIQNIGAYGVELKDVFEYLEAIELSTGELHRFSTDDCLFGYRDSIFKQALRGRFFIIKVVLRLSKIHQLHTSYGDIQRTLREMGVENPTIRDVSKAVIRIRRSKLPDPAVLGNAGSFFKNPEITPAQFQSLKSRFPNILHYDMPNGQVKIPAGWLIEQAGWKGYRSGDAGCHERQALVLVNYGHAKGAEILDVAQKIQASVLSRFGIALSPEVNIW
jgi:UDP-N-acetylmuramate dehydrogenase